MRIALKSAGLSDSSIAMVLCAHRVSSQRQYQTAWRVFLSYLDSKSLSSRDVTLAVVCDFLADRSAAFGHQYRTIASYKSALRHPLLFACGLEINTDLTALLMRGIFNYLPPQKASPMPVWSLNGVLSFL